MASEKNDYISDHNFQNYSCYTEFGELMDYDVETRNSFGTVSEDQNFDEVESLIENHPSITIIQEYNNNHPQIDYIDFSSSNLSCTKEDDFYGNDNTFEQTHVENSYMTETLTLQTESTSSNAESLTDREMLDCINDNTNESQQGEIWKSTKPAVLSFEGLFSNITIPSFINEDDFYGTVYTLGPTAVENSYMTAPLTFEPETISTSTESFTDREPAVISFEGVFTKSKKDIVGTTSPTCASNDKAKKRNEKATKTSKSKMTKKNNLSDKSKTILKESKNKTESSNDFLDTKFTEVKHHNTAIGSLMHRFCSRCDKTLPKKRNIRECKDCGSSTLIYKCLNCNEYHHNVYGALYKHIKQVCKPPSTFYCVECNHKTSRLWVAMIHFKLRHSTINKP